MSEPWLGHRDLCSIQWSDYCDCGDEPVKPPCGCVDSLWNGECDCGET